MRYLFIKYIKRVLALSLSFCLAVLAFTSTAHAQWRPSKETGLTQTPPLQLKNLSNQLINISNFSGKVIVVNFWASWCEPCREEFGELIYLREKYGSQGLVVLAVNLAEMKPRIMQFLKGNGISENAIEILLDRNSTTYKTWKARGIPTTFLVGKNSVVEGAWIGAIDDADAEDVKNKIEFLLKQ